VKRIEILEAEREDKMKELVCRRQQARDVLRTKKPKRTSSVTLHSPSIVQSNEPSGDLESLAAMSDEDLSALLPPSEELLTAEMIEEEISLDFIAQLYDAPA
jgi:hypothetical protein